MLTWEIGTNMERLSAVCATLLDDADVEVSLDARTATITLDFTAGGSLERVVFRCSRFWRFRYAKAADDDECVFVGETRVSVVEGGEAVREALTEGRQEPGVQSRGWRPPVRLFHVTTDGAATIDILCEGFEWRIEPPS